MRMGISLDQYRASIGGFKQPGMLLSTRRRRSDIWEDILGEMAVERIGREGRKLLIPLVNVFIGFFLVATWFFLIRQMEFVKKILKMDSGHPHPLIYF